MHKHNQGAFQSRLFQGLGRGTLPVIAASGLLTAACFVGMALLHDLLYYLIPFLVLYGLACLGYGVAVSRLLRGPEQGGTLPIIVCLAILFRVALLFTTPPTLSTDGLSLYLGRADDERGDQPVRSPHRFAAARCL
jgi:ABC-type transport system involved in multi-copper enzyme maturation permease subunit